MARRCVIVDNTSARQTFSEGSVIELFVSCISDTKRKARVLGVSQDIATKVVQKIPLKLEAP